MTTAPAPIEDRESDDDAEVSESEDVDETTPPTATTATIDDQAAPARNKGGRRFGQNYATGLSQYRTVKQEVDLAARTAVATRSVEIKLCTAYLSRVHLLYVYWRINRTDL